MRKAAGMLLLMCGFATFAFAVATLSAPEIDPGSAANALTILVGAFLLRRRPRGI